MKQVYRTKTQPIFGPRPQICGKARCLNTAGTVQEVYERLEKAAERLVREARWAGFMSPINELRKPLLELRLAKRKWAVIAPGGGPET